MSEQRSRTPEAPYCWQNKEALRKIRDAFDSTGNLGSAIAVYCALTEIASDKESETFDGGTGFLSYKSGIGTTTLKKVLKGLREIKVIDYPMQDGLRITRQITLLSMDAKRPTMDAKRPTLDIDAKKVFCPLVEVTEKEQEKEQREDSPSQAQSSPSPSIAGSDEKPSGAENAPVQKLRGEIPSLPSQAGLDFADWFRSTLPERVSLAKRWREQWAGAFDALVRTDKRDPDEIWRVSKWARVDSFWAKNFLTPLKLRQRNNEGVTYFDIFSAQINGSATRRKKNPPI